MNNELIPPDELIIANGIGILGRDTIGADFVAIGNGILAEMIHDGYILPTDNVLDVGCGLGRVARPLVKHLSQDGSYCGIDVSKSSIDWCSENYAGYSNFRFIHADVFNTEYNSKATVRAADYRFPLEADSINFIFSTSLFTHLILKDANNYLSEMSRVLKPGGKMCNTFMLLDTISEPLARLKPTENALSPGFQYEIEGGLTLILHNPEALISFYTNRIKALHTKHGLEIRDIKYGPWSGRSDNIRTGYQDVVIAEKQLNPRLFPVR